jgi:magnesium-transporting ATPase (P-type)
MNKMTLTHLSITNQVEYDCLNKSINQLNDFYKILVSFATICNKAIIIQKNEEKMSEKEYKGSATECGILKFSNNIVSIEDLRGKNPIINEIPFNSRNKFHLTLHRLNKESIIPSTCHSIVEASKDKDLLCIIKGAPEIIIDLCRTGLNKDQIEDFNQTKEICLNESVKLARNGERVLGLAFAFVSIKDDIAIDEDHLPQEFCFAGLLSLIDPPRPGVAEAVNSCHDGSIKVMMVTGDHPLTAVSIAKMVNIVSSDRVKNFQDLQNELSRIVKHEEPTPKCQVFNNKFKFINSIKEKILPKKAKVIAKKYNVEGAVVILGKDIPALTVEQWDFILSHNEIVFARTTPQNKLLIVKQLQRRGEIVTVTGDGVNDAPGNLFIS